jgi:hypothetical protein
LLAIVRPSHGVLPDSRDNVTISLTGSCPKYFGQRLAALPPRPRLHLIRFHGVLAPTFWVGNNLGAAIINIEPLE